MASATVILIASACASEKQSTQPATAPAISSSPTLSAPTDSSCRTSAYPVTTLPTAAPGEPVLSIPQPPGWELTTAQNSTLVRGAIRAPVLQSGDFVPNAVVTVADVTTDTDTPEGAIYIQKTAISQKTAINNVASGTVCTFPSETFDYTVDGRPTTSLVVGAQDSHGKTWASTVVIATANPTNPEFTKAKRAILDGFQLAFSNHG